jgi:uncharacterized SAM-binding protein YcdF (DUF218 family)
MSLGSLPSLLLIPPVNLLPLAVGGLILARWHPRWGMRLTAACLAGIWLLASPAIADRLIGALDSSIAAPPAGAAAPQAIVVLSAESREGMPGGILAGLDVGPLTLERLRAAAVLQRRTGLPLLTSGGMLRRGQPPVAALMATSLDRDFAVPTRWQETRSIDTWQNAFLSAEMLKREGITSVLVVSHSWHLRRAMIAFRAAGIAATAAPALLQVVPEAELDDFLPQSYAWQKSYFALHEWIGCAAYGLRAWWVENRG